VNAAEGFEGESQLIDLGSAACIDAGNESVDQVDEVEIGGADYR